MMMVGWIFMVLLVVGAVAVLVWGAASGGAFWARGDQKAEDRSALHILEDRFCQP